MDVIDWDANVDPDFKKHRFMRPTMCRGNEKYCEEWICYKSKLVCAKRLTIRPNQSVTIVDNAAYGLIAIEGYGEIGTWKVETPTLIRYGELTNDEFFVSEAAAKQGVTFTNASATEDLVILKHFAENPDLLVDFPEMK